MISSKMTFNFSEFLQKVNFEFIQETTQQRYGQFLMNYLTQNHPGVFIGMPEECDCFYDDKKVTNLLTYLRKISF